MRATKPAALRATPRLLSQRQAQKSSREPQPLNHQAYIAQARRRLQPGRARPIFDYMSPTQSHLLNTSLAGLVPTEVHYPKAFRKLLLDEPDLIPPPTVSESLRTPHFSSSTQNPTTADGPIATLEGRQVGKEEEEEPVPMPVGHHLVYFGPQAKPGELLPDGTEAHTAPGAPFTRRMWAGGRVSFPARPGGATGLLKIDGKKRGLRLDCTRAVCVEKVAGDPVIKGVQGKEKVFVEISRKYGRIDDRKELATSVRDVEDYPDIDETRTLVFMRELGDETGVPPQKAQTEKGEESADAGGAVKEMKEEEPPKERDMTRLKRLKDKNWTPTYSFSLTPTKQLLFQFSALTFNAHRIHLDQRYAQEVEGHRDLLVHGPLSLSLLLMVVRAQADRLAGSIEFRELNYRNLAPLYVDEEMKVCVRHRVAGLASPEGGREEQDWDVWVEGPDGGFAVKGTATVVLTKTPS
ncbi:hypothetical protein GE09DRAFT_711277 [Coniochaeta sp. 2T2.1]|nr:hypothetical protein GE09DRAFT_711277 [Coniochaeta sp. 2T2.1]